MLNKTLMSIALLVTTTPASMASAYIVPPIYTNGDDIIIVGFLRSDEADNPGGPSGPGVWACRYTPSTDETDWEQVNPGSGSAYLNDNALILGGSGDDLIEIINSTVALPANHGLGYCDGRTWRTIVYGSYYLDLSGDDGDDGLYNAYGYSYMWGGGSGGTDEDFLASVSWDTYSRSYGGGGKDRIEGASPVGNRDWLDGGAGDDCINDYGGNAEFIECGDGYDYVVSGEGEHCEQEYYSPTCPSAGGHPLPPGRPSQ